MTGRDRERRGRRRVGAALTVWLMTMGWLLAQEAPDPGELARLLAPNRPLEARVAALDSLLDRADDAGPRAVLEYAGAERDLDHAIRAALRARLEPPLTSHRVRLLTAVLKSPSEELQRMGLEAARRCDLPYVRLNQLDLLLDRPRSTHWPDQLVSFVTGRADPDVARGLLAVRPRTTDPDAIDRALYRLAPGRVAGVAFAGVWPPLGDDGLAREAGLHPFRRVGEPEVDLRLPGGAPPRRLGFGYRLEGATEGGVEGVVVVDGRELGRVVFGPGPDPLAASDGLSVALLDLAGPWSDVRVVSLRFATPVPRLLLQGVVRYERRSGPEPAPFLVFSPAAAGHPLLAVTGFMGGAGLAPSLDTDARSSELSFDLSSDPSDFDALWIDHWSPDESGSSWDVTLNRVPLLRIGSQPMPRHGRAELPPGALLRGRNVLAFSRREGSALLVEALRLRTRRPGS